MIADGTPNGEEIEIAMHNAIETAKHALTNTRAWGAPYGGIEQDVKVLEWLLEEGEVAGLGTD